MNTFAKRLLADSVESASGVFNEWQDAVFTAIGRNLAGRMVNFNAQAIEFDMPKDTLVMPRDFALIAKIVERYSLRVSMSPRRGKVTLMFFQTM